MNKITNSLRAQSFKAWLTSKLLGRLSHWQTVGPWSLSGEVVWQSRTERGRQGGSMPERLFSKQTSMSNSKNTQHHTFASVVYYFPTLLPIRGSKQEGNSPRNKLNS